MKPAYNLGGVAKPISNLSACPSAHLSLSFFFFTPLLLFLALDIFNAWQFAKRLLMLSSFLAST